MAAAEPVPEPVGLKLGTRGRETADVTEGQVEAQPCRAYFGQSSNLHFSVRAEIIGGIPVASDPLDRGAWRAMIHRAPAACSFPDENARSWEALGEARPGQSSLSAG